MNMTNECNRRDFLRSAAVLGSALFLDPTVFSRARRSILLFTKSSGYEHAVTKNTDGKPSVVEQALRGLGTRHGFDVMATKDGRIFDSNEFRAHSIMFFYTTGDLTKSGTDGNPPMSPRGKQVLLETVESGIGFVGAHAATDTFHPAPDTSSPADAAGKVESESGGQSEPYLRMLGGEFLAHAKIQPSKLIVEDLHFPGVTRPPENFNEEWYSLKQLTPDMHVILTLDTRNMKGEPYRRPAYPVTWARRQAKGRVFYTAMGHLAETWENEFFLSLVAGGIVWTMGDRTAKLDANIAKAAPGYAQLPTLTPPRASR